MQVTICDMCKDTIEKEAIRYSIYKYPGETGTVDLLLTYDDRDWDVCSPACMVALAKTVLED